jgi:cold-inducible RNA-binding protein
MNTIYVGNLPYSAMQDNLESLFAQYGAIRDVTIIKDRDTGRSKGFGFVTFADDQAAQAALAQNGQELDGRQLRVNIAKPRENRDRV